MSVGSRIREFRIEQHLLQRELAEKVGISRAVLSTYETDSVISIPYQVLIKICSALSCTPNDLYLDDLERTPLIMAKLSMLTPENQMRIDGYIDALLILQK